MSFAEWILALSAGKADFRGLPVRPRGLEAASNAVGLGRRGFIGAGRGASVPGDGAAIKDQ